MLRRLLVGLCASLCACSAGGSDAAAPPAAATYDVDALGIPRFVADNYLDLGMIEQISRFRSSAGHDYHDDFEVCRSMKHYFLPKASVDWSTLPIYAPVSGTIVLTRVETYGLQLVIRSSAQPAFTFTIFHVSPTAPVTPGTVVTRGAQLGWHIGPQTMSDIAVGVDTPSGYKLLSWFDVMTDGLFATYAARGVGSRAAAVITRAERDADPLTCAGETFTTAGTLANWLTLN
jgi:hypothetical protein